MDASLKAYLVCALWSSCNEAGDPLDDDYGIEDIDPQSVKEQAEQLVDFIEANTPDIAESGLSDEQVGHDFWLTRNRHGAGFWDRGLGAVGDRLADAAKVYGEVYIGENGDGTVSFQ